MNITITNTTQFRDFSVPFLNRYKIHHRFQYISFSYISVHRPCNLYSFIYFCIKIKLRFTRLFQASMCQPPFWMPAQMFCAVDQEANSQLMDVKWRLGY